MKLFVLKSSLVLATACASLGAQAITMFDVDTFTSGLTEGWSGGPDRSVTGGGPGGASDNYYHVNSSGSSGSGSRMATYNLNSEWVGDYESAGVSGLKFDFKNFGSTTMNLRAVLFDASGNIWTSTNAFTVNSGSNWQSVYLALNSGSMTLVAGSSDWSTSYQNVDRIMIRHADDLSSNGTAVRASVGFDNIQAVPEPGTMTAIIAGLAALTRRRKR